MKYILGLDVGIGSVGWAVVRCDEPKRIEDFGVRIFDSGELQKGKERTSQQRRRFRSMRRQIRRRAHRKYLLKKHFEYIGLITDTELKRYYETSTPNILQLRVKGLTEKLTPNELAACMLHICKHRGYRDFYDIDEAALNEMSKTEREEYQKEREGRQRVDKLMEENNYQTVAQLFLYDKNFKDYNGNINYRNHPNKAETYLASKDMLRKEAELILETQHNWHTCLTEDAVKKTVDIIFKQRDFEDGPGNPDDTTRKYKGFLEFLGKCIFYNEPRGFRYTVLADIYALINVLSQYRYLNKANNEYELPREAAKSLVNFAMQNGRITQNDVKSILKPFQI